MLAIQKKYINYNYSRRSSKPKYIVIHDTGNPGAGANNHYIYFNGGNRGASADFFVDSNNIIQTVNTDVNYSWAVGDGKGAYGITNANSCSIEMCLEKDGMPSESTIQNTIELTRYLMSYYGISIECVKRHYDASHKSCPNSFMANNWAKWHEFKSKVSGTQTETKVENVVVATSPVTDTKSNVQKAKEYVGDRCKELQEKLRPVTIRRLSAAPRPGRIKNTQHTASAAKTIQNHIAFCLPCMPGKYRPRLSCSLYRGDGAK